MSIAHPITRHRPLARTPPCRRYVTKYSVVPPGGEWYSVSCSISSDGSGAVDTELATFAWITQNALAARVTTYSMVRAAGPRHLRTCTRDRQLVTLRHVVTAVGYVHEYAWA